MRTLMIAATGFVLVSTVRGQVTQRVSVTSGGGQASALCTNLSISADGRYVALQSAAPLVPGDTNSCQDVFVRDRQLGTTERVSVASGGAQGMGHSGRPSLSADARYVAFYSDARNLVTPDLNGAFGDAFVRDRQLGTTERVSVSSAGVQGNEATLSVSISADGRFVATESLATNLVPGDTNGARDVFVHDRRFGTTERVSVDSVGVQGDAESWGPSISADGRYVAFYSLAANLVPGDTPGNNTWDVFVRDRQLGTTDCVSIDLAGAPSSSGLYASISADGRYVAFTGASANLVVGDTNGTTDVFVRDRQLGTTELASVDSAGIQGDGPSYYTPSISADGWCVAFASDSTNLVPGDTNGVQDVFVRDRQLGTTERVSVDSAGIQGDGPGTWDYCPPISADGRYVSFASESTNLVPGDTNGVADVFLRDRYGGPDFTSSCVPGTAGVIACPCSNPSGGFGQGCDNSSATGGALLTASGGTYVSSDSLVFTTLGEKPTALSIVWQGPTSSAVGWVFGQGVRCVGGTLKRLYQKNAVGGSITAPDFAAGDLTVSARSAAVNVPIQAGETRYYFVSYRDPVVLGGCPSVATFNATQAGGVTWSP